MNEEEKEKEPLEGYTRLVKKGVNNILDATRDASYINWLYGLLFIGLESVGDLEIRSEVGRIHYQKEFGDDDSKIE